MIRRNYRMGEPERYQQQPGRNAPSLELACLRWVRMPRRDIRGKEMQRMERMIGRYITPIARGRSVRWMDDTFRGEIYAEMKRLRASVESRELVLGILRGTAEDALRRGWIRYNPFLESPPLWTGEGKKYPALTDEEVQKLMRLDPRKAENACMQVQLLTGMRPAEARGLCWSDVMEREGSILIRHQMREGKTVPVMGTKNYRQRRIQPAGVTFDILREVRENQREPGKLVFVDEEGRGLSGRRLNQLLRDILGRDSVRLHDLRVTHATMMYRKTRDLHQVARRLGHSGMEVTRRHYVRVESDLCQARAAQDRHYAYLQGEGTGK